MTRRQEKMLEDAIVILEQLEEDVRIKELSPSYVANTVHYAINLIYLAVKHEARLVR